MPVVLPYHNFIPGCWLCTHLVHYSGYALTGSVVERSKRCFWLPRQCRVPRRPGQVRSVRSRRWTPLCLHSGKQHNAIAPTLVPIFRPCSRCGHNVAQLLTIHPSGILRTRTSAGVVRHLCGKGGNKTPTGTDWITGNSHEANERCTVQPMAQSQKNNGVQGLVQNPKQSLQGASPV